jgi:uncharacterized membrane protein YfbV (UPF0208 family)
MFERPFSAGRIVKMILAALIFVPLAACALGFVLMALWNALMPAIFGLKAITFWQAAGLFILGRLLFGGLHRSHGGGFRSKRKLMERWDRMSPEERERIRQGLHGRHCC